MGPSTLNLLKAAIRDYLNGLISFYLLTDILFGMFGFFDGNLFTSFDGSIRAKVIGNEQLIFCFA